MAPDTIIGVDIGGTFTDFVVYRPIQGNLETFKLLSSPDDPSEVVLRGLEQIHSLKETLTNQTLRVSKDPKGLDVRIIHGSTVATNALLERKGARTALVTTRGFGDLLQIGRQNRPELYDFFADPPPSLIPEELRFEVDERVGAQGEILHPLDMSEVEKIISRLQSQGVESVAICLLFSFLRPEHELLIAGRLRETGMLVSPSCEILPEYREYERASTTAVNAYVSPALDHYLSRLEEELGKEIILRVMQSNGGQISLGEARRNGVRCILSGPAGGVVGAKYVSEVALNPESYRSAPEAAKSGVKVIAFDMGGTSTDVSLIDGSPQTTNEAIVGGCPIRIPVLDIHTIGAGGGSIARADAGGALRVGPQSAGANPGPACYGRGESPTVTDANLVLGRLSAEHFLGGKMPLDVERAEQALAHLGKELGLDPYQAALGVVEVINAHMERALRVISVERGHDPRLYTLLSFGGAGGLHAADLARRLGIPQVLAPPLASTLSAFGMLAAEVVKDYLQTVMLPGDTHLDEIDKRLEPLTVRGFEEIKAEGIPPQDISVERFLDMRYQGQSYELSVPFSQNLLVDFHNQHRQVYGYAQPDAPLEIVNVRVRATGQVGPPTIPSQPFGDADPELALIDYRTVRLSSGNARLPFYRGEALQPGNQIDGPSVVIRSDTTILIGASDHAQVDTYGNLLITVGKP